MARLPSTVRRPLGRARRRVVRALGGVYPPPRKPVVQPAAPGGPAPVLTPDERRTLRRECALGPDNADPRILEIGAAHNGTFPKRDGFRTSIVDHADRDGLVEKYQGFSQYSMDDIEDVDYVLADGVSLVEAVDQTFDLVYASHVVEHSTSLIHFLNECAELLAEGGVLALVVPDRRYTFDRFRERSSLGRVIDTHTSRPSVHTLGTMTEFAVSAVKHRGSTSWVAGHRGTFSMVNTSEQARVIAARAKGEGYVDVHNWVFTPHHLRLLLHDLHEVGYVELRESFFHDTVGHEFSINLSREAPGPSLTREELVVLADDELRTMETPVFG